MAARRRWGWAIAILVGTAMLGTISAYFVVTQTKWGREQFIAWAIDSANGAFNGRGKLKVGVLRELSSDGIYATDVSLLDTAGVVVLHINEVRGKLAYSELLDKAVHITDLDVRGVQLNLKRGFVGAWNISYIISGGPPSTGPHLKSFGDDIRIDAVRLSDGKIDMQYPWAPNDFFKGAARDSVIALRKSLHKIAVVPQGFLESREIILPRVVSHEVMVQVPGKKLSSLKLDTLGGTISDPAVRIVQAGGNLHWTPDSLLLDLPSVALPASTASAKGKVNWNLPGAVRYDVLVDAKAALSDLGWIWDVLPTDGKGSAQVRMRTLASADDAEYSLSNLDVSAMQSHVTGDITVVSRVADMLLQNVNLSFEPLRTELLRRLSYDAVPESIKGTLHGHLVAKRGGPLTSFFVDHVDGVFDDDRVPGAQSSIVASGQVGFGASPTARSVNVADFSVDLRTARNIAPSMPPVDGIIKGTASIASADLKQAIVPQLDLLWTDAAGNASHVTGSAEARYANKVPFINTELLFDPITLLAFVRIDSTFPLTPTLRGTVSATGFLDSLQWKATLVNGADKVQGSGLASLRDSVWMVQANTELASIDLRHWLARKDVPETALNGSVNFQVDAQQLRDSTIRISHAEVSTDLKQAAAENRPEFKLRGTGGLDAERMHVDSATAILGGITMNSHGALARDSVASDTLIFELQADSLDAARPELLRLASMLQAVDTTLAATLRSYASDTLKGDLSGSAVMVGSLPRFGANASLSARAVQVGAIQLRRVFGSLGATGLPNDPHFNATATVDDITGIGRIRLASAAFRIDSASPTGGKLRIDVVARDTTALRVRGAFTRKDDVLAVTMDSLRFNYSDAFWTNSNQVRIVSDARGIRVDSLLAKSNKNGLLALSADIPVSGAILGDLRLERFPAGEVASFATGSTTPYHGLLSGSSKLSGTRDAPLLALNMRADSVGTDAAIAPPLVIDASYENRRMVAHAVLADSVRSSLRAEARVPIDLALRAVDKRLLSDNLDAEIVADSLLLAKLPNLVQGVTKLQGVLNGKLAVSGTVDHPIGTGRLTLENFGATIDALGINPIEGRVVLTAQEDQLTVEQFRFRSGDHAVDTVGITGVLKFPVGKPASVEASLIANNAVMAKQSDGTDVVLSGSISAKGPLKRPDVAASLFVPKANLVADPLGARSALDLGSAQARELLGATEVPVASGTMAPLTRLGQHMNVTQASLSLGDEVWIRTPEAAIKLGGALDIKTGADGLLAFDGEVLANRGTYQLDLYAVKRTFTVDSGKVRFYGNESIAPTVGVYATHVVRVSGGVETPIHVAITGTFDKLNLALSTEDEVFSGAPENEVISLLIFGAPTFALPGQSQSTVKAVSSVLLPTFGDAIGGRLQKLLPVVNTLQFSTATGQENLNSAAAFLDNLNVAAGKQLGDKIFLRLNGGVCRGSTGGSDLRFTGGLSAEYRITRTLLAQVGMDQGASPCTQIGGTGSLPRWQFGFDLFREWVF
ncbi:MAG: translocation/assembly module TamB domain-containing protein [Gemmatimonadaceae bacterium]